MKSHTGLGHVLCPVCLAITDTVVLLDKRLKQSLNRENFAGWLLCEEHEHQLNEGYTALIETTTVNPNTLLDTGRTGNYGMIKEAAFDAVFDTKPMKQIAFVEVGILDHLQQMSNEQYVDGIGSA